MSKVLNLIFAWWNTGLSPSAKTRAGDEERQTALAVILYLLFEESVDFLALGEISEEDISVFRQISDFDAYRIESGVSKTGRVTFDTCFIYRADKLDVNTVEEINLA